MTDAKPRQSTDSTQQPLLAGSPVPHAPPPPSPSPSPLPPARRYSGRADEDEDADPPPFKITLSVLVRLLLSVLLFTNSLLQGASYPDEALSVVFCVASWAAFFWNVLAALSHVLAPLCGGAGAGGRSSWQRLPQISVVLGEREVVLFGGRDGDGDGEDGAKKRRLSCGSAVDLGFAVLLLVLFVLMLAIPYHVHYWWSSSRYCNGIVGLSIAIVCLEFLIVLLALFPRRSPIQILVRLPVQGDRIQLP